MGLDSVEIIMAWEESFGIDIADREAAALRTPRLAINLICDWVGADRLHTPGGCLCQRAFHRLRRAFLAVLGCPRAAIKPRTRLADVVPRKNRRSIQQALCAQVGVPTLPGLRFGLTFLTPHRTVADLARFLVAYHPRSLRRSDEAWTGGQVREVVRAVVTEQLGIAEFADSADFIHDLRVD